MSYYFDENKKAFIIENYNDKKPFASFLPGISGVDGIPMWTYYVNRGQLISSFGIRDKDHSILDFSPANLAYKRTSLEGFRTFIKINNEIIEPFSVNNRSKQKMIIEKNSVSIEDDLAVFKIKVKYFNITNESFPGLVRKVTIESNEKIEISFIDGLSNIWPYNLDNYMVKNMSNLAVAWFDVLNLEKNCPFIKNRSTTEDSTSVNEVEQGNFFMSIDKNNKILKTVVDPTLIFGNDTSNLFPKNFLENDYESIIESRQNINNQLLSAYTVNKIILNKNDSYSFYSLFSSSNSLKHYEAITNQISYEFLENNEYQAEKLVNELTDKFNVKTNFPVFDEYMKQSFLDNILRGGYPFVFKGSREDIIYHAFSRIHGDMEREYNNFSIEDSKYSQGNGSYRDVNQNRRNDVYFVKEAGLFNIKQFLELIQTDGYNPLTIRGTLLKVLNKENILSYVKINKNKLDFFLDEEFTLGKLIKFLEVNEILLNVDLNYFIKIVLKEAIQKSNAIFGTGYWSDHWVYNLDLLENYLNIFPDKLDSLLFDNKVKFYQSHMSVKGKKDRYVLTEDNKLIQTNSVYNDYEKMEKTKLVKEQTNFHKDSLLREIEVVVFVKYLHLALIKFANLDQHLMGIMMEAEKPGWNDAMNGLPLLFGSGVSETINLLKLFKYLEKWVKIFRDNLISIPVDIYNFMINLYNNIDNGFDAIQEVKDNFNENVRIFLDDKVINVKLSELEEIISRLLSTLNNSVNKTLLDNDGVLPTFLTYEYKNEKWELKKLPLFLEAPASYLKHFARDKEAISLYNKIKNSELYDKEFGLYLTSESLDKESLSIGRTRAFTKGWLERESSFLHMSYKYLIGLLKSGLYNEFYQDIKTQMPPFMDPNIYGRSTLENVSFIASSKNPNTNVQGRGFVARLTGSTSEAITMLYLMLLGEKPFEVINDKLNFKVLPKITSEFFKDNKIEYTFLGFKIILINEKKHKDTLNLKPNRYVLINENETIEIRESQITGEKAIEIRNNKYQIINVYLS